MIPAGPYNGFSMVFLPDKCPAMLYTELQVTSNFSFLRGASHPAELVEQAALLGYGSIGITDRNTFAGIVRAHTAAKKSGIRLLPGCRIDLQDGPSLLAYPTDKKAYAQLSALLSAGNLRTEKGDCLLYKADIYSAGSGIQWIVIPPAQLDANFQFPSSFVEALQEYREAFGFQLQLAATRRYMGDDSKQLYRLEALATTLSVPLLATNDVHYHHPERRQLQDVVTCIREKCSIFTAGYRLHLNAERYLKPEAEMLRLFRQYPAAIHRAKELAEECRFSLDQLQYQYPEEITSHGRTPQEELTWLAWEGARQRYPQGIPEKIAAAIRYELAFMEQMDYA
ncbi:MAG TPA: PHP domain-containing protein, partial [Chitinophagaceae bacterium]|nr:PHP domain-containing protein [Chitinophagaceae bacterium]